MTPDEAAQTEAERRWALWLPTGDYETDAEYYSEHDAEWQNAEAVQLRRAFVAGAAWLRGQDSGARVEYGIVRPDGHAYMDGRDRYTQIVGTTFRSREQAEAALKNVPSLRDREALVVARVAPSEWWEVEP